MADEGILPRRIIFPPVDSALVEPDGLLAMGGDLEPDTLLHAYRHGIFPWFEPGSPIMWWTPDPRLVLFPEKLHISRSLTKQLKTTAFHVTTDQEFAAVINLCAAPRDKQGSTWITDEMKSAYIALHAMGYAHSIECWHGDNLAGGLYGIAIGKIFFGESMFALEDNASKIAFCVLVKRLLADGYKLIDCQVKTQHLESLGAELVSRKTFIELLDQYTKETNIPEKWSWCWPLGQQT